MSEHQSYAVGLDGVRPIYNPDGRWTTFSISEVWLGKEGTNGTGTGARYVPKVNDHVVEPSTNERWVVDSLDPVSLVPVLRKIMVRPDVGLDEEDILAGVGPVTTVDNFRVYINSMYTPYSMIVDSQLKVGGTDVTFAKIFRGVDITNQGNVVSKIYDGNGGFVSENVPLRLAAAGYQTNHSIKVVEPCNTVETFEDGELITVVFYNDKGQLVSRAHLLADNTNAVRPREADEKYVTHISANSPFMSPTIPNTIDFPLNFTIESLNLMGTVHYSDGSTMSLPIDGGKFTMHGLEQHLSSIVGQRVPLVLAYNLSAGESAIAGLADSNESVTLPFNLVTVNPNHSYSVKLFGYPDWKGEYEGYHMRWWMLNIDRNVFFEVTPFVKYIHTGGAYNPKAYGVIQSRQVSINLKDVSGAFKPFVHTQKVDIVLNAPPIRGNTPWTVSHESIQTRPYYGQDLLAELRPGNKFTIHTGITEFSEWMERVFERTYPLTHREVEVSPPTPTHIEVAYGLRKTQYPIEDWNKEFSHDGTLTQNKLVTIKFLKRLTGSDLVISVAAMMVDNT